MPVLNSIHKKLLFLLVIITIGLISVWVFTKYQPTQKKLSPAPISTLTLQSPAVSTPTPIVSTDIIQETQTYRNEEWGFEFQYPADWEIKENTFGSAVSMFNLVVEPSSIVHFPHPVRINILSNDWIERVQKSFEASGIKPFEIQIDGVSGIGYEHVSEGLSQIDYIFPLGADRIVIGGKEQYKDVLDDVLASFKFLK
ncbi:MAG: PsbP-related protein [Patescibacteria group bacterium]